MNAKKTPDQRFLDAQIALIMGTADEDLDEILLAAGFDSKELATRGTMSVERALSAIDQARQASDTLSSLPVTRQRDIAMALGLRRSVFAALVEHRALVETIPKWLLKKLAMEVGATLEVIKHALAGPVLSTAAQHKSDQAPVVPKQVPFEQLLRDASMTETEITELMRKEA